MSSPRLLIGRDLPALLIVASILVAFPGAAQEEPPELVTDRPDQTESAEVVPRGFFQLEGGWTHTADEQNGETERSDDIGNLLLRIGLSKKMELRLGWNGFTSRDRRAASIEDRQQGVRDADLGVKIKLTEQLGARPKVAFLGALVLPVGDDELTSSRFDPSFRFAFAHHLSDRLVVGYNLGMVWESEIDLDDDRKLLSSGIYTLASGIAFTDSVAIYVELFGSIPASASGTPSHSFDTGFVWLVRPRLQLDIEAGVGLSGAAADWFVGAGLSVRFPR
jgi:hypothetical protein